MNQKFNEVYNKVDDYGVKISQIRQKNNQQSVRAVRNSDQEDIQATIKESTKLFRDDLNTKIEDTRKKLKDEITEITEECIKINKILDKELFGIESKEEPELMSPRDKEE